MARILSLPRGARIARPQSLIKLYPLCKERPGRRIVYLAASLPVREFQRRSGLAPASVIAGIRQAVERDWLLVYDPQTPGGPFLYAIPTPVNDPGVS
jgi:hypothetical protein